jgi:hypothetical protein
MTFSCEICGKKLASEKSALSKQHVNSKFHQNALKSEEKKPKKILTEKTKPVTKPKSKPKSKKSTKVSDGSPMSMLIHEIEQIKQRLTAIERNLGIHIEKRNKIKITVPRET